MPYKIMTENDQTCVVKTSGEKVHCYSGDGAEGKAKRLMAALFANVEDATVSKSYAVKTLTEDAAGCTVGGYLLLWGNSKVKDLQGDWFTPKTELLLDHYKAAPAMFHHGLDSSIGLAVIGKRVSAKADETGVFVQNWLDKSNKYWAMVEPLLQAGRLFYSPGSVPHMVKRVNNKPGELLSFPVVEDTLTPTPVQYRLRPVEQIQAAYKAANIEWPADVTATADAGASDVDVLRLRSDVETLLIELSEV